MTTHIVIVPNDSSSGVYEAMYKTCDELDRYAKSMNAYFTTLSMYSIISLEALLCKAFFVFQLILTSEMSTLIGMHLQTFQ